MLDDYCADFLLPLIFMISFFIFRCFRRLFVFRYFSADYAIIYFRHAFLSYMPLF